MPTIEVCVRCGIELSPRRVRYLRGQGWTDLWCSECAASQRATFRHQDDLEKSYQQAREARRAVQAREYAEWRKGRYEERLREEEASRQYRDWYQDQTLV